MERQSLPTQIVIGACIAAFFTILSQAINPTPVYMLSTAGIGLILGGAVSGALLYVVLYRFRFRQK
jgi:hypothetical protein